MAHEDVLPVLLHVSPRFSLLHDVKLEEVAVVVALLDYCVTFACFMRFSSGRSTTSEPSSPSQHLAQA